MFPRDPSFANLSRKKMFRQKRNSSENGIPAVQVEHAYAVRAKQMAMAWIKDAHDNIKEELLATITVAFLALRPLFWNNPLDPRIIRDQTTIIEALREGPDSYQIPASLKDDTAMMKALVYVNGYPEIEQAMQMLWALALQSS
jgi:hypothetical protein